MRYKYFQIIVHYSGDRKDRLKEFFEINGRIPTIKDFGNLLISGHTIKALSEENALEIANRHGIGNPFNSKYVDKRTCQILDMRYSHNRALITRRKKGIGGSVWYEDKIGNLKKEI
jgi:hypothetical protein